MEQSLEQKLSQEARERELQNLFDTGDINGLLKAAMLLNVAFGQQQTINRWLAHEAASNLGEAWEASRKNQVANLKR